MKPDFWYFIVIDCIYTMSVEEEQELSKFIFRDSAQFQEEVRLHLFNPRFNSQPLSTSDLFELQIKYPILKRFSLTETESNIQVNAILCFESVEDAIDFQQQEKQSLTYSVALMSSQQNQLTKQIINQLYQPEKLQKHIEDQGFCIVNGAICLKKITSMQFLVNQQEPEKNCYDGQSTLVHTERKISIEQKSQPQIEIISKNFQVETTIVETQVQQKVSIKPFVDGILLTSILYGGFKIIKYLAKI